MFDIFEIYCCAHLIYCQAYFFPKYDEKCWKKVTLKNILANVVEWIDCSVLQKEVAKLYEYQNHILTLAAFWKVPLP